MGFIYGKECLGGLVGAHVTAMPTHIVLSKYLSMSTIIPFCVVKSCTNEAEGFTKCFHQCTYLLFSDEVDKLKPGLDTTLITHDMADVTGSLLDGQRVPGLCSSSALLAVQPYLSPSTAWICAAGVGPGRWWHCSSRCSERCREPAWRVCACG